MQPMSGMDASFVYGGTPSWHMHAGTLIVLDPSTAPGGVDVHRLRALVQARAGLLGPFLRRLVEVPFGLDRPAQLPRPRRLRLRRVPGDRGPPLAACRRDISGVRRIPKGGKEECFAPKESVQGKRVRRRPVALFPDKSPRISERLAERFAFVVDGGGRACLFEWERRSERRRRNLVECALDRLPHPTVIRVGRVRVVTQPAETP